MPKAEMMTTLDAETINGLRPDDLYPNEWWPDAKHLNALCDLALDVLVRCEAAERDAARLSWMEEYKPHITYFKRSGVVWNGVAKKLIELEWDEPSRFVDADTIREAIDEAMRAKESDRG